MWLPCGGLSESSAILDSIFHSNALCLIITPQAVAEASLPLPDSLLLSKLLSCLLLFVVYDVNVWKVMHKEYNNKILNSKFLTFIWGILLSEWKSMTVLLLRGSLHENDLFLQRTTRICFKYYICKKTGIAISESSSDLLLPKNLSAPQRLLAFPLDILRVCLHKQLFVQAIMGECTFSKIFNPLS